MTGKDAYPTPRKRMTGRMPLPPRKKNDRQDAYPTLRKKNDRQGCLSHTKEEE
jgi:hypothetical protein